MTTAEVTQPPAAAATGRKGVARPDKEAHDKTVAEINAKIEQLKAKQAAAHEKINGTDNIKGSFDGKRKELRDEIDQLIKQRQALSEGRSKTLEQIKTIQANLRKKSDEERSSKDRLGYKTVADVEAQINNLEKQLQSGQAKLIEEKRIVAEISNLQKAKKVIEGYSSQQAQVEEEKKKLAELRASLDAKNPERDAVNKKIDEVKARLNELDSERKQQMGSFTDLVNERKAVKAEIDAQYDLLRKVRTEYKQQQDVFYTWQKEERNRKQEQYKAQRAAEQEERIARQAEREREAAEIPAYTDEINDCLALIKYLQTYAAGGNKSESSSTAGSSTPTNLRQVDSDVPAGATVMLRKSDRLENEDFLVMGGKKGKKGRRGGANGAAAADGGAAQPKAVKLDFETIQKLINLQIEIPTSPADVEKCIEALEGKQKWFKEHQKEQTEKNKKKAEDKIKALKVKAVNGEEGGAAEEATEEAKEEVESA